MRLIDDAKSAWRLWSVRLGVLGVALPQVWAAVPRDQQEAILDLVGLRGLTALVSLMFALVVAARVVKQDLGGKS